MMKRFLVAICLSVVTLGVIPAVADDTYPPTTNSLNQTSQSSIKWYTNYNDAVQDAQKNHKPILLFFTGSDWCGWCKKMQHEIFNSPDFANKVGGSFVFVEVDFPNKKQLPQPLTEQNTQLKQKYGITSYPTVVILDSNGNYIADTGYRPGGGKAYADYLDDLLPN